MKGLGIFTIWAFFAFELSQAKEKDWWETTTIYQVYPRSFKDSDGNGIGDLNGIHEKLDYIKDLGIETVWIQPFYESPMADLGYDVSNFEQIEPMFGTMEDFKRLLQGIHDRGMKLILDLVPNHVSSESEWFLKSLNKEEPYTDFFVWQDPKDYDKNGKPLPPNNWISVFGGSAWEWNEKRQQFYLRQFSAGQPDLNFRNLEVRKAMEEVMRFWLDLGVDGFRIDAIMFLIEAEHLEDEPLWPRAKYTYPYYGGGEYSSLNHIYTTNQPETYEVTREWRLLLEEYSAKDNKTRILCSEAYTSMEFLMKYFGNATDRSVHFPFYFGMMGVSYQTPAMMMSQLTHLFMDHMPKHGVANWVVSNHDNPRLASRMSPMFVDAMNMVSLLLPGVASIYYGDEIGMEDSPVREDQYMDPNNGGSDRKDTRDACRAPMQWDQTDNAGFTTNKTSWLPLNPNYWFKNVAAQSKTPQSHLNIFKHLMELRRSPVIKDGELETCALSKWVFMYIRKLKGAAPIVVLVNLGSETESVCAKICSDYLPDVMGVYTASSHSGYQPSDKFVVFNGGAQCSKLRPKAGVVLTDPGSLHSSASCALSSLRIFVFSIMLTLFYWSS